MDTLTDVNRPPKGGRRITLTPSIVDRGGEGTDPLIRRYLEEIRKRLAAALTIQTSIARLMEESGSERRDATAREGPRDALRSNLKGTHT